jgi:long-chain acyl-CoA synthetase
MNPALWLTRIARIAPLNPALLIGTDIQCDYATFANRAACIATQFSTQGVGQGDKIAIFAKNCCEYLEAFYGAWFLGAVVVPINAKLHPREAAWIIADSGASLCLVDAGNMDVMNDLVGQEVNVVPLSNLGRWAVRDHAPQPAPFEMRQDDVIWLFYTSGTTGRPKGVMLTATNLMLMALTYMRDVDDVSVKDAILYAAPMSHGAGLYNLMHVMRGARHVVPPSGGFLADEVLLLSQNLRNVSMFAAPTMVRRLIDEARAKGCEGDGIKTIVYGGGPMYQADIIEAVETLGPRFVQIYGQGECPMAITVLSRSEVADRNHPNWKSRLTSVGRAQSATEIRILNEDGTYLDVDEIGEIAVRGGAVMAGYWNNPDATKAVLQDGWLKTGDMGLFDTDGFLTLHDRSKDVIISGGTNIYPREVEEVLLAHPSVHEASVVGKRDPEWGEVVVAFVSPVAGQQINPRELDQHCIDNIARFKRPKDYHIRAELPKSSYGKILKTELRKSLGDA